MISRLPESHREARQRRAAVYGGGKYLDGERKSRWQSPGSSREIPRVVSRGSARGALPRVLTIIIPLRRAHASRTREPKMIWSKEFENVNFLRRFTTSSTHCSVRFTLIFSDKKLHDFFFRAGYFYRKSARTSWRVYWKRGESDFKALCRSTWRYCWFESLKILKEELVLWQKQLVKAITGSFKFIYYYWMLPLKLVIGPCKT